MNKTREIIENAIANEFHYDDIESLRKILQQYDNLKELSELGYQSAHNIVIDIDNALKKSDLNELERDILIWIEIQRCTLQEIANKIGKSTFYVFNLNRNALSKLYLYLNGSDSNGQ